MEKSSAATTHKPLLMQENNSITFEERALVNQRMVTKSDGKQEPFSLEKLQGHLRQCLEGLNKENFDLDMIADKVSKGLYNGKLLWLIVISTHPT